MLEIKGTSFEFSHAGLFTTNAEWIHPTISQERHEIIYVSKGNVHIIEDGKKYDLEKNDVLLLEAEKKHGGYMVSNGTTSFFWLHFSCPDINKLGLPRYLKNFNETAIFKELIHAYCNPIRDQFYLDSACAHLFAKILSSAATPTLSKNAIEIFEWIRINANARLSVQALADQFEYTPEHISRIIKKSYNTSPKTLINDFIIKRANDLLCNSTSSVKEIATILEFSDSNSFVKFYKYHENISPSNFRNKYSSTIMNKE